MPILTYKHTHIHTYANTHIKTYTRTHIHAYTHTHKYTHSKMYTYTHTHFFHTIIMVFFCVYNKVDKKSEEAKRDKCKNMTLKINISTLIINKEVLSLTANSS